MAFTTETSRRSSTIPPFIAMDVMERAMEIEKSGRQVIHLEVGEPDFDTPEPVKAAAARAMREGKTHYTSSLGIQELREEISAYYQRTYGVKVDPGKIVVTSGTSPAMVLVFAALLDHGDEVILSDPHYACYPNYIRFVGGVPTYVRVYEDNGFSFDINDLKRRIGGRTKAVFVNSPANPTGVVLDEGQLRDLAALDIPVVSDEIYHGLVYEGRARSMLEFTDRSVVINGFSKVFAMTGWRLGYAILPGYLVRAVQKMQQNIFICASSVAQYAAIAALRDCRDFVESMRVTYDTRRKYLIRRLRDMGFGIAYEPKGAFYILANARRFSNDSYRLAFDILEKAHVAVTPGIDFGDNAEGYLRFSYANSLENIREGLDRLEAYLQNL